MNQAYCDPLSVIEWRPVPGYEGLYDVSELGAIRRRRRLVGARAGKQRLLRQQELNPKLVKGNSLIVCLCDHNGAQRRVSVRRMVANAFVLNPQRRPLVRAIDGDPFNNAAENIEWYGEPERRPEAWAPLVHKA